MHVFKKSLKASICFEKGLVLQRVKGLVHCPPVFFNNT